MRATGLVTQTSEWPEASKYFVPGHFNLKHIRQLLNEGSIYEWDKQPEATCGTVPTLLCRPNGAIELRQLRSIGEDQNILHDQDPSATGQNNQTVTLVMAIGQKRCYFESRTVCRLQLAKERWISLLEHYEVLAPALEMLHDNNGGNGSHISTCKDVGTKACSKPFQPGSICAYHIYFKLGDWGNDECFVYLQFDAHQARTYVLLAGTTYAQQVEDLRDTLSGIKEAINPFTLILAILSSWYELIEEQRWLHDWDVQDIEAKSGHSSLTYHVKPLAPEQLRLTNEIAITADNIQGCTRVATNLETLLEFAILQCKVFHDRLPADHYFKKTVNQLSPTQLVDALQQKRSQVVAQRLQMGDLYARVRAQFEIINSLIAQSDSKANIDMATTSLADTSIMRDITLLTFLFLPGTFLATFFSMVFFNMSEEGDNVRISRWIWIYFVFAVPLTLGMGWRFGKRYWVDLHTKPSLSEVTNSRTQSL